MKWLRDHQSTEFNQKEKKETVILNSPTKDMKRPAELKEDGKLLEIQLIRSSSA